jgi:hypothetical protein
VLTKRLTAHVLRHTFCTNLRNNGADISFIKDLAGHQSIQTTARYYLGKDNEVLRRVVDTCLDYSTGDRNPAINRRNSAANSWQSTNLTELPIEVNVSVETLTSGYETSRTPPKQAPSSVESAPINHLLSKENST